MFYTVVGQVGRIEGCWLLGGQVWPFFSNSGMLFAWGDVFGIPRCPPMGLWRMPCFVPEGGLGRGGRWGGLLVGRAVGVGGDRP